MALSIPEISSVIAAGMTHDDHNQEVAEHFPNIPAYYSTRPMFLLKARTSLCPCDAPVVLPDPGRFVPRENYSGPFGQVTGEVELGVVLSKRAVRISPEEAEDIIAGYTILNDVSQRDMQRYGYPIAMCKGFHTFGPIGPAIVTRSQLPNVDRCHFQLRVNGVVQQDGTLAALLYPIAKLISDASYIYCLDPGTVVTTGSPGGMFGYSLQPGDRMEAEIEGIGILKNPVISFADE